MKAFINKTITELSNSNALNSNSLIKMLVESTKNSIASGDSTSHTYNTLKDGLSSLNSHLNDKTLNIILEQMKKFEYSDSNKVDEIGAELNLMEELSIIRNSDAHSDPIIFHNVNVTTDKLKTEPNFRCYEFFINAFSKYTMYESINNAVNKVNTYLSKNQDKLLVLEAIHIMKTTATDLYTDSIDKLSLALVSESYSSDFIKYKLNFKLPVVNELYNRLSVLESSRDSSFSIGGGNASCTIRNTVSPSMKIGKNTVVLYMDDKFIALSGKSLKNGNKLSSGAKSNIYEMNTEHIKNKYSEFYTLCESFYKLGFKPNHLGSGIVSTQIKNFSMEFKAEEDGILNLYVNENKIEDPNAINFSELLMVESLDVKTRVSNILKSTDSIFNFEFIKTLTNQLTLKEAYVMELNSDFHICEKINNVERIWKNDINEHKLYGYIMENFKYDISPIFKVKINEQVQAIKDIVSKKEEIIINISKLEENIKKIDENMASGEIDSTYFNQLETIKEQLETKIISLKEQSVRYDLKKKELAL